MSLRDQVVSGIAWSGIARVISQVLQYVVMVALMRILLPDVFGIMAMAMVFFGFTLIFNELGFGQALVQYPDLEERHQHTVFWANLLMSLVLIGVFYTAAPYIADFYDEPSLTGVCRLLCVSFLLLAVGTVPNALLQREMKFDQLAKIHVVSGAISGGMALGMAFSGYGVWSLVAQYLVRYAVDAVMACAYQGWYPRLQGSIDALRDVFRFGIELSGFNMLNYWARKSDDLLIGRVMGSASLGVYDRAYRLMLFPVTQVIYVVQKVMFSALSSIQEDVDRVRRTYLRAMGVLTMIIAPFMVGLALTAESLTYAILGSEWKDVIPIIEILSLVGVVQTLCNPVGWIYKARGRTDRMFLWGIVASATLIGAIVLGVWMGTIETVAWAYLIANVVLAYPCIQYAGKIIDMSFMDVMRSVYQPLVCVIVMAVAVWIVRDYMLSEQHAYLFQLTILVGTGAITYVGSAIVGQIEPYQNLLRVMKKQSDCDTYST